MIDKGANPFVVDYNGQVADLDEENLKNLPEQKSIFFITRPLDSHDESKAGFLDPWFYRTGVFDGKFVKIIGRGASGTVISGEWYGKKAAFKFVEIGAEKFKEKMADGLKTLDKSFSEMVSIESTVGSKIVLFYGHYRQQIHQDDNPKLGELLGFEKGSVKKYDVK